MKWLTTSPWIFLALSRLFTATRARECIFTSPEDTYFNYTEEAYSALNGCTTIIAETINISPLYDSLYLPSVTHITGTIVVERYKDTGGGYPILPAIKMPNLEYLGGLDIKDATGLQNVTMPRLKEVTGRVSIEMKRGWRLDFRSLERAPAIRVVGRLEEIHLDSLQTVNNDLVVNNCGACGDWDGTNAVMKYKDALVLSLGSLVSVGYIEIAGYLRAIGISNLISAGPPQDPDDGSLSMDSGARFHLAQVMASFSLNLTKLESVNKQLYIHGELDGLSIPALKTANATIHIDASTPLDIDLPLKTANSIDLLGRITSVHLPNLTPSTPITLTSTYKCKPLDSVTNVTCAIPSPGLSMEAKVGMGMGITVGVALVMFAVVFCCRRSRGRKMTGRSSSELADLPAYGDSNSRARATGSPVVPVPQGRPETPPPPYSVDPA